MPPAFTSFRQTTAFAVLLAVLLALPALVAHAGWLNRRDLYPAIPVRYGPSPWIQQKLVAETGDVDVVFLGSSHIWCAVDTPFVQKMLSEQLGREAKVFSLGYPWGGFDVMYSLGRDLLEHRRVHMLVIDDEDDDPNDGPHIQSAHWLRMGDDPELLAGLPWVGRASLYGSAVLGMPRQLLSLLRPNRIEDPALGLPNFWNVYYQAPNLAEHLGSLSARLAYNYRPDFVDFSPSTSAASSDVMLYSGETHDAFGFSGPHSGPYQLNFARRLAQLCAANGTRLVILKTPRLSRRKETVVSEREFWPEALKAPVDMLGIPPAKLFAGMRDEDVRKLFYEDMHLNQNGQKLFTPLITPALLRLYATSQKQ